MTPRPPARLIAPSIVNLLLLAAGCDAAPPATAPAAPQPQSLPTITVPVHGSPLVLQVADDEAEREKGLMFTRAMPADHGMIFVFPVERTLGFWMRNTPIDLDIIYADHAGTVVAVKTMRAYDESTVSSEEPATFAVELNAGAAERMKIKVGEHLELPVDLTTHVK